MFESVHLQNTEVMRLHLRISLILLYPITLVHFQQVQIAHFDVCFIEFAGSELLKGFLVVHEAEVANAFEDVSLDPQRLSARDLVMNPLERCLLGRVDAPVHKDVLIVANHFLVVELVNFFAVDALSLGVNPPKVHATLCDSDSLIRLKVAHLVIVLLESSEDVALDILLVLLDGTVDLSLVDPFHVVGLCGIVQLLTIFLELLFVAIGEEGDQASHGDNLSGPALQLVGDVHLEADTRKVLDHDFLHPVLSRIVGLLPGDLSLIEVLNPNQECSADGIASGLSHNMVSKLLESIHSHPMLLEAIETLSLQHMLVVLVGPGSALLTTLAMPS